MNRKFLGLLLLLVLIACGGGTKFFVTVTFPDQSARDQTKQVRIVSVKPSVGASCQLLLDGTASPGDANDTVEDEVTTAYPPNGAVRALNVGEQGPRLFFAEASDGTAALLRGCTGVTAVSNSVKDLTIALAWIQAPCQTAGAACGNCKSCNDSGKCVDDLSRNADCPKCQQCGSGGTCLNEKSGSDVKGECSDSLYCNGLETCDGNGSCQNGTNPCGQLNCDEGLDSCTGCANDGQCPLCKTCADGACADQPSGSDIKHECPATTCRPAGCDGHGACQLATVGSKCATCQSCDAAGSCVDDLSRNSDCPKCQECAAGGICLNQPDGGDVKDECQAASCLTGTCDGKGGCGVVRPGTSCDDGAYCNGTDQCDGVGNCQHSGDPCSGGVPCSNVCSEKFQNCIAPSGAPCSDGVACTDDSCDGLGTCVGVPNNAICGGTLVCIPACAPGSSGCATPPASMNLYCDEPVQLPGNSTLCDFDLHGLSGQVPCLSCVAMVGAVELDVTDFFQNDPDGWTLVSGNTCAQTVNACTLGTEDQPCCADFSSIWTYDYLVSDMGSNCGGGVGEWRLQKIFDFSNLANNRVCIALLDSAVDLNDGFLIYAGDANHTPQKIFCLNGPANPGSDNSLVWYCADLPSWADNNAAVTITMLAHSQTAGHKILLDYLFVYGMNPACAGPVFTEDFACVSSNLPPSFNGWTVTGTVRCGIASGCYDGSAVAHAANSNGTMTRTIDTTGLFDVSLCFYVGDTGANSFGEEVLIEFNTGSGWQTAFDWDHDLGVDGTCRQECVDLSDIDPAAADNPNMQLRITMTSNSVTQVMDLDHITVSGGRVCSLPDAVTLGSLVEDSANNGNYYFDVTRNGPNTQLGVWIQCFWGDPSLGADAVNVVRFLP